MKKVLFFITFLMAALVINAQSTNVAVNNKQQPTVKMTAAKSTSTPASTQAATPVAKKASKTAAKPATKHTMKHVAKPTVKHAVKHSAKPAVPATPAAKK